MFTNNPIFRDLDLISQGISRFFPGVSNFSENLPYNFPLVNIQGNSDKIIVQWEVPGLKKEDMEISINKDLLTISGEIKNEKNVEDQIIRTERYFGKFSRSVELPHEVISEKSVANLEDGILTITMPVSEETKPRKIEIK